MYSGPLWPQPVSASTPSTKIANKPLRILKASDYHFIALYNRTKNTKSNRTQWDE